MLRIYPVILAFVGDVYPFIERIGRHDPDLARQLRRASASVVLNTAEGMYARGRQRTASYNIALREMRESYAALEVSVRLRYIAPLPEACQRYCASVSFFAAGDLARGERGARRSFWFSSALCLATCLICLTISGWRRPSRANPSLSRT